MTEEKIKRNVRCVLSGKRIRDFLPELPDGVKPAYIQYMDTIHKLQGNGVQRVKISDISDSLAIPRPGDYKDGQRDGRKVLSEEDFV